jgi:adhesin HecA-like repeat protein
VQFGGADRQTSQVYASVLFLDPATYGGSGMRAQGENIDNTSGKDNLLDWRNTVVGVTGTQVSGINDDDQEGLSYARNLTIVPPPGVGTKGNGGFYVGPSADVVLDIADFIAPNTADYSGLSGTTLYTNNNAASIDTLFPNLNGSVVALSKFANYAGAQSIYMPPDLSAGFNLNDWLARVSTMYEPNGGWPVGQDPANYTPFATWPEAGNLSTPTVTALTHTATELTATCSDAGGWIYAFVSSKETTGTFAQLRHGVEHDGHFDGSTDDPADVGNPQGHVAVYRVSGSGAQTYTLPQNAAGKYVHVVHEASDGAHTAVTTSAEAFVPSDVASLAHNWSFSDTASLTGDPVTQINDLEGAVNLTAVNGPARTALNGLTAGDFDGTNDGLEDTAGFTATAKTVVAVARPDVIAATSILNNRGGIGTNDRLYISTSRVVVGGTVFNYSPALSTVSPSIIVSTVSGVNTTATVNVHVNGDTTPVTGSAAVGTLAASFGIGKYPGSSTAFFNGVIGEVLIFDAVLSTLDRQKVEGYLANKWGVTLEAGHPYEDAPP